MKGKGGERAVGVRAQVVNDLAAVIAGRADEGWCFLLLGEEFVAFGKWGALEFCEERALCIE